MKSKLRARSSSLKPVVVGAGEQRLREELQREPGREDPAQPQREPELALVEPAKR